MLTLVIQVYSSKISLAIRKLEFLLIKPQSIVFILLLSFVFSFCQQKDSDLEKAKKHFEEKKYQKAILLYDKILDKHSGDIDLKEAHRYLEKALYYSATKFFDDKDYQQAKEQYRRLVISYPKSSYKKEAQRNLSLCTFYIGEKLFQDKEYHKTLKEFKNLKTNSTLSSNIKNKLEDYSSKSLYQISLQHKKDEYYYLATERLTELIIEYPKSKWAKAGKVLREECYFKDGELQFNKKAYDNAKNIFKKLLNGKYSAQAKNYLQKIKSIRPKNSKKVDPIKVAERTLTDKGDELKDPYLNEDIITLYNYLDKQKKKNPEKTKKEIFPIYEGKFVDLKEIEINRKGYKALNNKDLLKLKEQEIPQFLFSDKKKKKKATKKIKYALYSKNIQYLTFLLTETEFFKINFSDPIEPLKVKGKIQVIRLEGEIKIYIIPDSFKQYKPKKK